MERELTIAGETFLTSGGIIIHRVKTAFSFLASLHGMQRTLEKPLLRDCGLLLRIYIIEMIGSFSRKMQNI